MEAKMNNQMSISDELFETCDDIDRALDDLASIWERIVDAGVDVRPRWFRGQVMGDIELALNNLYKLAEDMPKLMRGEDE